MKLTAGQSVAVTGASGFIGSHVCVHALKHGLIVRAVVRDAKNAEKTEFLRAIAAQLGFGDNLTFHSGDLLTPGSYDAAFKGVDAVVHTAAVVMLEGDARQIVDASIVGVTNVLESIKKSGSVKRLVHTSSVAAVYRFTDPSGTTYSEEDWNTVSSIANGDPYGFAKAEAERVVWEAAKTESSFDVAVINPGVVLGQCLSKAHTKASPLYVRQMIYGNPIPPRVYIMGAVDVANVAEAHVVALLKDEAAGKRFLLVGNEEPILSTDLATVSRPVRPDLKLDSPPMQSSATVSLFYMLSMIPVVGSFVLSPYQSNVIDKKLLFKNDRAKKILGIQFTDLKTTIKATIDSMVDTGFIKARKAKL